MMDSEILRRGAKSYHEFNRGVIIFLCAFNPFDGKHRLYHAKNHLLETPDFPYEDRALKIFACTEGKSDDTPVEILRFLSYLKDSQASDGLTEKIESAVSSYRLSPSWRGQYMENHAYEWDLLDKGRKQGIAQGKTEGEERYGKLIRALISDGKESLIPKTVDDPELRESLYRRYGIA